MTSPFRNEEIQAQAERPHEVTYRRAEKDNGVKTAKVQTEENE